MKSAVVPAEPLESFFPREVLIDPTLSYDRRRTILLSGGKAFLEHHNERIREEHRQGASGRKTVGMLTSLTDTLIRNLYRSVSVDLPEQGQSGCTLIALGGYGR